MLTTSTPGCDDRGMNKTKIETGIYQRQDGRLHVHTTATDPYTGEIRHKRATLDEGATLEDARQKRAELKREVTQARVQSVSAGSVEDYAERWLKRKVSPPKPLKPTTADTYLRAMEAFCSFCGAVPIETVTRVDVIGYRDWLQTLRKDDGSPYSSSSLGAWWRPVLTMLRDAVADGLIQRDPTFRIEAPETRVHNTREQQTLSRAELGRLVDFARKVAPQRAAEITTLAYTGMRSGELWGLQWRDIDWMAPAIHIRRSVSLDTVMKGTKTGTGRTVYMPDVVGFAIAEHYTKLAAPPLLGDLVFPTRDGKPRQRNSLRKSLDLVAERAGIEQRVTPQVLRRTFDTLMVSAGVDRIVLRSMIGHSSEEMTERYAGVRLEDKRHALMRVIRGGQ